MLSNITFYDFAFVLICHCFYICFFIAINSVFCNLYFQKTQDYSVRRRLRDPAFSRFGILLVCDREINRHATTAYTASTK